MVNIWLFNEEQLRAALAAYCARAAQECDTDHPNAVANVFEKELRAFLTSPEATEAKLMMHVKQ